MSETLKKDSAHTKRVQDAAERVRVARTMAAAFPSVERDNELAAAMEDFKRVRDEPK